MAVVLSPYLTCEEAYLLATFAKSLAKEIRTNFPKVQPQIQGDAVRVMAKSKDDLQRVIQHLRGKEDELPVALQFTNYR